MAGFLDRPGCFAAFRRAGLAAETDAAAQQRADDGHIFFTEARLFS